MTEAKRKMLRLCKNPKARFIDQYFWAVCVFAGLYEANFDDIKAAEKVFRTIEENKIPPREKGRVTKEDHRRLARMLRPLGWERRRK